MQETAVTFARRALPYGVTAVALIAGMLVIRPYAVGVFHDDGAYAVLAQSIAGGHGLSFLQLPGAPAAIHYPPAYPLLLSAVWWLAPVFPGNLTILLALNALFLGAVAFGVYRLCVGTLRWTPVQAAIASVVSTLSYPLLLLTGTLLSEPMFIAVLLLMLPAAERVLSGFRPRSFAMFGLAAGGLALIRTHGLALPAAVMLLLLWRRRWKEAALCAGGVLIALLPWQAWQAANAGDLPAALQGSYGSYASWFIEGLRADGFLPRTLATNARELWAHLVGRFAPVDAAPWNVTGPIAALAAFIYGGWRASRLAPVTVWTTIVYMGVVILWPYSPWRFLFAIWPILIVLIGEAARGAIPAAFARRPAGSVMAVPVGLLVAGILSREGRALIERSWSVPARVAAAQTLPGMLWILRNTTERDVVASEVPELVYLYTGRRAVPMMPFIAAEYGVPRSVDLDRGNVARTIGELPVNFVVTISPPLAAAVAALSPAPVQVHSAPTFTAFKVR